MLVNLSDVLTSEGKVQKTSVPLEMTSFKSRLGSFKILEKSPAAFIFSNVEADKAHIEGCVELKFDTKCDRCLDDAPTVLTLQFDRLVTSPGAAAEDEEDDLTFMEGYQLDVEAFVYHEILLNWPAKILCSEDCKGVCPVCGKNRNKTDCGCDTFVPDPRMAAIQDIFNANKEV